MDRFLHHYRRWNAHKDSLGLEKKMKATACKRLAPVVRSAVEFAGDNNFGGHGLSFVHAAFAELLECRTVLQHSYAFSYLRYKTPEQHRTKSRRRILAEKVVYEESQGDLEMVTEQISDVVARSHLRATQTQIRFLTSAAAEKRREFSDLMVNVLVEAKLQSNKANGIPRPLAKSRKLPKSIVNTILNNNYGSSGSREIEAAIRASRSLQEAEASGGDWSCLACTYQNSGGRRCAMCNTVRPSS